MSVLVSSRLDYINRGLEPQLSLDQIDHELKHLGRRKMGSKAATVIFTALAVVAFVGVLGLGHILFGAFAAVALLSYVYASFCEDAQKALREKKIVMQHPDLNIDEEQSFVSQVKNLWELLSGK